MSVSSFLPESFGFVKGVAGCILIENDVAW